jgi:predicted phosphoribosyltransferase
VAYFQDRADAGRRLASRLTEFKGRGDVLVLGLPRGGVPVAAEVARALDAPLDVFLVRKLGVPGQAELAMGAIAEGGLTVVGEDVTGDLGISKAAIEAVAARERMELERRGRAYRRDDSTPQVAGRLVILVDDGLATGATMEAAIRALRLRSPVAIVAAAPVGARETCDRLARVADRVVCLATPEPFSAVSLWYADFAQTTDEEVIAILAAGRAGHDRNDSA